MGKDQAEAKTWKERWREAWPILMSTLAYMIPLFWLWSEVDYPESFGLHITAHGEAGLLESWWNSYLLIERHRPWDVITFVYMWSGVIGTLVWLTWTFMRDRKAERLAPSANGADEQKGRP